jgi:hypothetical protein
MQETAQYFEKPHTKIMKFCQNHSSLIYIVLVPRNGLTKGANHRNAILTFVKQNTAHFFLHPYLALIARGYLAWE